MKLNFHVDADGLVGSKFEYVGWGQILTGLESLRNVVNHRCLQVTMMLKEMA